MSKLPGGHGLADLRDSLAIHFWPAETRAGKKRLSLFLEHNVIFKKKKTLFNQISLTGMTK